MTGNQTLSSVRQGSGQTNQSETLIDLVGLDDQNVSPPVHQPSISSLSIPADLLCGSTVTNHHNPSLSAPSTALSLLDEELLSLGLSEPTAVPSETASVSLSDNLSSLQDITQGFDLFGTTSSSAPAFSTSALFPDALSTTVSSARAATTNSSLTNQVDIFSLPPVSTAALSSTLDIFAQPPGPASTAAAPVPLPQCSSVTSPTLSASPMALQQFSDSARGSHSSAASLCHNLQDLALLDLGSPKNTASLVDVGGMLNKSNNPDNPAAHSSNLGVPTSATSTSMLLEGVHGGSSQADDSSLLRSLSPVLSLSQPSPSRVQEVSLTTVFVPLDAIKPSQVCPVTAYDRNGVRVLLHFATNSPPDRPDVLVMVASMLNTAPLTVRNIVLQAAVPKTMKVKLQPPSGTELAPFNPILPPPAVTQVMLLANPLKEKVRMRYKLTFTLGEQPHTEVGEVNDFPPADRWGAL